MAKRILFLLPSIGKHPIGGFKVVYEYANRLAADGYSIGVIYPAYCSLIGESLFVTFLRRCKALWRFFSILRTKTYLCNWFNLDDRVKEYWVWSLAEKYVPEADIYIATAINTAVYLNRYKHLSNDNKYYFIQGFETWGGATRDQVIETYHFPMNKIVIAHWLEDIIHQVGEKCTLVYDGFDFQYFRKYKDLNLRNRFTICMLYHTSEGKGCKDGFAALNIVKEKFPSLQVNIFGVYSRPDDLPEWYHYYQTPDKETHNRLYNDSAIFIGTSRVEGWGLTIGEAMICGCAVACTDNLGYLEMAMEENTALVSSVGDVEALAFNIIRLIEDDDLRFRISEAGHRNIQQFTWESSYTKFKETIIR